MKTTLVILASVLLIAGMVGISIAETQQAVTASVSINGAASITISNSTLTFGNVDADDGDKVPTENPLTVTIDSNTVYNVKTASDDTAFTGPGTLNDEQLKWATTLEGTYTGYDTTEVTVTTGSAGGGNHDLYHKLTVPAGTTAGSYNLPITLTVTA